VLRLVVEGGSNAEVGLKLGIAPKTVDTHKRHLKKKLGLETSMDLLKFAIREGITRA
jgi:DNA-binding CsgD family transcriptional regulator